MIFLMGIKSSMINSPTLSLKVSSRSWSPNATTVLATPAHTFAPRESISPPMYQRRAAKFGQALGLVGDSHSVFGAENTYFLTNPCQPYKAMLLFVSKSQANPAQAGDVKLKGPTGSAGCRQRPAVIFAGPAALRIFEAQDLTGMEQFGGRIDQSCAETSLRTCGVQNRIY